LQILAQQLSNRKQTALDNGRKKILSKMLSDNPNMTWRRLATCQRVIGADTDTTKRLLIEIGARGSETDDLNWGLDISKPVQGRPKRGLISGWASDLSRPNAANPVPRPSS
jgi:hypothetical protein